MDSERFASPIKGIFCGGLNAYCMHIRPLFLRTSGSSGVLKALLLERNGQLSCNPQNKKNPTLTALNADEGRSAPHGGNRAARQHRGNQTRGYPYNSCGRGRGRRIGNNPANGRGFGPGRGYYNSGRGNNNSGRGYNNPGGGYHNPPRGYNTPVTQKKKKKKKVTTPLTTLPETITVQTEDRQLKHTVFTEIQALSGCKFTLDAASNDDGSNALCTEFCSPSNSFLDGVRIGHMWINAPFTKLMPFFFFFFFFFLFYGWERHSLQRCNERNHKCL